MKTIYTIGLDIGSTTSKGIVLKNGKDIVVNSIVPFGTGTFGPQRVMEELLKGAEITREDIDQLVVTGYGRVHFPGADKQVSELTCHAKGARYLLPTAETVIDIGGQDAKVMKLNEKGNLMNFVMNDKCAAGTGRFLDVMARIIGVDVSELGPISGKANQIASISSTCTVFAESEVISHLSSQIPVEDIVAGVHESVAKRVSSLAKRAGIQGNIVLVGGVSKNTGVVKAMERALDTPIMTHESAQLTGAIGSAIYAYNDFTKHMKE